MSDKGSQLWNERLLPGHRVLVTGAAGDIGAAICAELEAAGAEVVRCDQRAGPGVIACDVTDECSTAAAFESAGQLSDVVHAVGIGSVGPVAEVELAEWNRVVAVNLTGSFVVAREAARRLGAGGTYCASKFGVIGLMQCVAQELADRRIRVNAVCPGAVEGSMTDELIGRLAVMQGIEPAALRARYEDGCPMGRFADPREVGRTCVYLVSDLASYVSGSSVVVDGAELTA
jgi:NAD(P)-dependent dehydrogenase (short-subunit alcohol dehydrogenase family)